MASEIETRGKGLSLGKKVVQSTLGSKKAFGPLGREIKERTELESGV